MLRHSVPVLLIGLACCPAAVGVQPGEVYRQSLRGTAWVITPTKGKGTGWVVDRDRKWLITNLHVVGEHETVDVVFPLYRAGRLITDAHLLHPEHARIAAPGSGGLRARAAQDPRATWR